MHHPSVPIQSLRGGRPLFEQRRVPGFWTAAAMTALVVSAGLVAACAAQPPSDARAVRLTNNLQVYDMYDNSRAWGPSFLVGPPAHHLGDETRIDDTRLVPRVDSEDGTGSADPAAPPVQTGAPGALMTKPLPPVP